MPYDERLRALISCFEEASAWERTDDSDPVAEAISRAVDGGIGELFYEHVGTSARLHLRMSGQEAQMMDGILDQPLDPCIDEKGDKDTFTGLLSATHAAIARRYGTEYVSPKSDPQMIAALSIPFDFQKENVGEAIDALEQIATDINQLHEELRTVVEEYRRRNV